MRIWKPAVLVIPLILGLAACSASVDKANVEQQISQQMAAQVGESPDSVTCPGDLPAEVGAKLECTLTEAGESLPVTVTVTSIEGSTVNFDIQVADATS